MNIPLSQPDITEAEIEAVTAVLRSPQLSLGPRLVEFEQAMAGFAGVRHGIGVNSGTSGLHLCVRALGIGEGDEVIVPSFTFIAAANAIRYERAMPVFADIDPLTLNLDPAQVEAAITPRTRAIMAVHNFGIPAPMDALLDIAARHRLVVIEDACEAIGAEYRGRRVGSFGHAAVFAFYPNKQITTGEGGMIVTRDAALAAKMRAWRNQGRYDSADWLQHEELGYNYRLPEINCALGLVQLRRLSEMLAARSSVAAMYNRVLAGVPELILPVLDVPESRQSWFVYVVRLADRFTAQHRDRLAAYLQEQGIGCARYFAPIHRQPSSRAWSAAHLPVTEAVAARTLALPFFNRLGEDQIARVADVLQAGLRTL
ncbi:DegT/DnrJ/EryC1/StrS family aminotransferase [Silvibacterium dinghuense]|uniref:DegT/DnrJ/EryC1/StrS family aminotransferase n=1 Tax=Silvibacterium dinghuense TaxID=1560006 RepID=A0A4Q1SBC5_9BACT|nr:DegT/DnrJ/EryC1/StrS family aminotransferase [Silvibacterium dinghuense]RXS94309.1 DegT/DnrJ/EryC1/StrS family aminotransferase [Silvibacterium dinghuense]GGH17031.1 polysaccharide biosynthesis protein [Silvibacterium dinghuense]